MQELKVALSTDTILQGVVATINELAGRLLIDCKGFLLDLCIKNGKIWRIILPGSNLSTLAKVEKLGV